LPRNKNVLKPFNIEPPWQTIIREPNPVE
jgi:hypothetical protein